MDSVIKENRKSKYTVDCITASGVFRISVFHNGTLLNGSDYDFPWVYVLPSSVSKENYLHMVSDLIALNERLVAKERSAVGMGARTYIAEETDKLADEIKKYAEFILPVDSIPYATSILNIATAYRAGGRLDDALEE